MSRREDFRFHLTDSESDQWHADIERIRPVLGQLQHKALILQAVHVLAWLIDHLDHLDLGALAKVMFK